MSERTDERAVTNYDGDDGPGQDAREKPSSGPLLFLPFLVMFVFGLWLLGWSFEEGNGVLWGVALLLCGAAYAIPMHLLRD